MANEWQSLLQGPTQSVNLVDLAQGAYGKAQDQKVKAYEQFRLQKAQDIASKSVRPDGTMDWDNMFKLGSQAGIGLDTFNQVDAMMKQRAERESTIKQQQGLLRSMGEDRGNWDPSAKPVDVLMREQQARSQAQAESINQVPVTVNYDAFNASVPSTVESPIAPAPTTYSAPVAGQAQEARDIFAPDPSVNDQTGGANEVQITAQAPQMSPMFAMQDIPQAQMDRPSLPANDGYYNSLWRDTSNYGSQQPLEMQGAGPDGKVPGGFDASGMSRDQQDRLANYLNSRGVPGKTVQDQVNALEQKAVDAVQKPVAVMPEGTDIAAINKASNINIKNKAEYISKVAEAKIKFSEDMQKGNFEVLDKSLAQSSNELAKAESGRKQAEFTRDREAANNLVQMGITEKAMPNADVKALQDVFVPAISDIQQATNGFGGAMQAAVAKAKVDGSLNMDNIVSNLVAMNAMPSADASAIRASMSPEAYTSVVSMAAGDAVKFFKDGLSSIGFKSGSGARNKDWVRNALLNVTEQAKTHGMSDKYIKSKIATVTPWQEQSPSEALGAKPNATKATKATPKANAESNKPVRRKATAGDF